MIKTIFRDSLIAITLLAVPALATAEYRCGWLDNPSAGHFQFIDKQAAWTISKPGVYQLAATSINNLPKRVESEFIRTNGEFGYSCSCLSVSTDSKSKRITKIAHLGKQVLLKRCLEDKSIADRRQSGLLFPTAATQAKASGISNFSRPTGSYTDKPVLSASERARSGASTDRVRARSGSTKANKMHYIQVIVTSMPEKAKRLKQRFERAGFKTIISQMNSKGRVLHKVRIGPFKNRRTALTRQTKLRKSFSKDAGVQKSIIVG